jgi:hypothetical protein
MYTHCFYDIMHAPDETKGCGNNRCHIIEIYTRIYIKAYLSCQINHSLKAFYIKS